MGNAASLSFNSCENLNLENITDVNEIVRCVNILEGVPANSASPTDIYIIQFNNDTKYNGEPLEFGFQKLFISKIREDIFDENSKFLDLPDLVMKDSYTKDGKSFPFQKISFLSSQIIKYEYYIYKLKIAPLIFSNISPHFIKFLGGLTETNYSNIIDYLSDSTGMYDKTRTSLNFKRNFLCMINNFEKRKSIDDDDQKIPLYNEDLDTTLLYEIVKQERFRNEFFNPENYQYGFILNEAISKPSTGQPRVIGESITMNGWFDQEFDENEAMNIIFQVLQACYCLFLSGVAHNDLHTGNVYIKKIPKSVIRYIINKREYLIETENMVMIYDFDRSYVNGIINPLITDKILESYNQTNELREGKDFIKNIKYLISKYKKIGKDKQFKNMFMNVILKDIRNKGIWDLRVDDSFLRQRVNYPYKDLITDDEWSFISPYPQMIEKLYTLLLNHPSNDVNVDKVYILDERMFTDNKYVTPNGINKVINEIFKEDKDKLRDMQKKFNDLQIKYDELDDLINNITSDSDFDDII